MLYSHTDSVAPVQQTGRKSFLTVEEMRMYRAERALAPWYVKVYRVLFSN